MKAPQLNRKLVLEAPVQVPDGAGGFSETWSVLGTLWAAIKLGTGREDETAGLSVSSISYRITVRAAPYGAPSRPAPGHRLVEGGRRFRIFAVGEADAGAQYLMCFAREEVTT
ncbi:MAG: head-tail adaptor protein [Rhodobacter sp.]|nr:head-tail adaptor protein [Rhodobacter sp.]